MKEIEVLYTLVVVFGITLVYYYTKVKDYSSDLEHQKNMLYKEKNSYNYEIQEHLKTINSKALVMLEEFKAKEVSSITNSLERSIKADFLMRLERWKEEWEITIREDAIKRSKSTLHGKASEQIAPFYSKFPFDTRDARFIGSPVDFIIFAGAANEEQVTIYFMEVKTGKSTMSNKQKLIRDAVLLKRVVWREWNPDN